MSENTLSRQRSFSHSEGHTLSTSLDSHQQQQESQWIDAYTKLAAAFHEKENEIVQVAQIGQALLEQNKKNEDTIEELNRHVAEKDAEITDLKKKLRIQTLLRKQNSKFELGVKEVSVDDDDVATNVDLDALNASQDSIQFNTNTLLQEEHNYLINAHKLLQENYDKMQEEYHRVQEEYDSTNKSLAKKEKQLSKEVNDLRERQIQYNEQVESLQQQIKEAAQREQQIKTQNHQLESSKKELQEQIKTLEDKINSLDKVVARDFQSKNQKETEILSLKNRIVELESAATELRQNEASLQDTVSALVKRNHTLYQEKEEIEHFLQETSNQIRRNTITERDLANTAMISHSPSSTQHHTFQSSLLSELEESLQEKIKAEIAQIKETASNEGEDKTSTTATTAEPSAPQKSHSGFDSQVSESEFFFLTAAAVKVGLIMKFPHKSSLIVQVNIKKLYDQAQQENVPFHEWHNFITSSFGNIMFRDTNPSSTGVTTINNLLTNSSGENGLFSDNENKGTTKRSSKENVNLDWLELKSAVPKNAVETMSPYPEQNELLHRLFKLFDSEFVIEYFTCDLDEQFQIRGTLFVTLESVYFYAKSSNPSNLKFPEIKISLRFVDVTSILIKKGFLGIRSTSITIQAKNTGNVPRFTFTTFKNLDYAYEVIYKHWRNWSDSLSKSQAVKTTDDVKPTATPNAPPTQAQFKKDRKKSSTWFGAN